MKLKEYLDSDGIHLSENICLIGNDYFPGNVHQCIDWEKTEAFSKSSKIGKAIRSILGRKEHYKFRLPPGNAVLFYGRVDRSVDSLSELKYLFREISKQESQYIILCGKGDYEVCEELIASMPSNVFKLIINNLNLENERLAYFPMGRDFRSRDLFNKYSPNKNKSSIVYCNFSVSTHPIREKIYDSLKGKDFIRFDHMGNFLSYELTRDEFYKRLSSSKFAICPRGNAIDTFRMWDCLYLGTIPIVHREAAFHNQIDDLPILFVDSVDDFSSLTVDYLEEKYSQMLDSSWNYEKLKLSYWMANATSGFTS